MSLQGFVDAASRPQLLVLAACLTLSYVIVTIIHRLYLHPLAKFPGPFWARLTGFPSYWHTLHGDRHIWLWQLQQQYGDTFRYTPDSVLINTPSAYKTIFGSKGNVKKGQYYKVWPRKVTALTTWNTTEIPIHARKRRVMNHAFSDKALRNTEPFVHSNIDRLCELIEEEATGKEWSEPLNMTDWINWLVFDILGDLCFGKCFDMKEHDSQLRHVPEMMVSFLQLGHPLAFAPFTALWVWLKPRGLDWLLAATTPAAAKGWETFVGKCLVERTKAEEEMEQKPKGEVRQDFFHYLFKADDPETGKRGYSLDELWGESELLTIAGSDTTAIVLTAVFFYLTRNPEVMEQLTKEVLSTFSKYEDIKSGPQLHSCKYLRAVLSETMRMSPPIAAELSREVLPGGTIVDGHHFPEGCHVSTGLYCLSYNSNVYPEPFKFRPDRWIVDENDKTGASAQEVALAEEGFCTFSTGSRGCIGKNLAWLEMTIVVAKMLYKFEIKRDPASTIGEGDVNGIWGRRTVDQYQTKDVFVSVRNGPMIQFKKRAHV